MNLETMMYDYPIGNIVYYEDTMLQVVAQKFNAPSCLGCFFSRSERRKRGQPDKGCISHKMLCVASKRNDKHHVIFKKIN